VLDVVQFGENHLGMDLEAGTGGTGCRFMTFVEAVLFSRKQG
jgi:hypothetical protein